MGGVYTGQTWDALCTMGCLGALGGHLKQRLYSIENEGLLCTEFLPGAKAKEILLFPSQQNEPFRCPLPVPALVANTWVSSSGHRTPADRLAFTFEGFFCTAEY